MAPCDNETMYRIRALAAAAPTLFVIVVILIGVVRPLFLPKEDPLDVGVDKAERLIAQINVTDNSLNGFRVVYATTEGVTEARASEIRSRPHIGDSLERLKLEAPRHFGDMLHTDIWEFTEYALMFGPDPDVAIHNVFVYGREKTNLYVGPNPAIENPAKWINPNNLQGVLYIKRKDILRHTSDSKRVYRYWRCRMPYDLSDTDEHWSHFPEDERIH